MKNSRMFRTGLAAGLSFVFMTSAALASPTLRSGSSGHEVFLLQQKLKSVGYAIRSVDGVFGTETEQAVAEFQRDQSIRVTGVVTNATWRALKNAKARTWGSDSSQPEANMLPIPKNSGKPAPNNQPILAPAKVNAIIQTAKSYIGVPYKFGGATPKAFDCSGYLQYVFAQNGITIPRTSDEQYKLGRRTASSRQLVPGDLVFFTTYEPGASHCGIYLGNDEFIHASSSKGVRIDKLSNSYWSPRYYGGKHIVK